MLNEELEQLKVLLFSEDDANYDLVFELAKAIDLGSWSVYNELKKCAEFFNLHKRIRPTIRECIRYVQKNQFNLSSNTFNYLPEYLQVLEPIVKIVRLDSNKFTSIPSIIFAFSRLEELSLRFNNITEISSELWKLPYLQTLDISYNPIIKIDKGILNSKRINNINLCSPTFVDLPEELAQVTSLKSLIWGRFGNNYDVIKPIPSALFLCTSLEKLTLIGSIWGELPNSIGLLKNLKELSVKDAQISLLPDSILNLKQLRKLTLNTTKSFNQIISIIFQMHQLEELTLSVYPNEHQYSLFGQLQNLKTLQFISSNTSYIGRAAIQEQLKQYLPNTKIII